MTLLKVLPLEKLPPTKVRGPVPKTLFPWVKMVPLLKTVPPVQKFSVLVKEAALLPLITRLPPPVKGPLRLVFWEFVMLAAPTAFWNKYVSPPRKIDEPAIPEPRLTVLVVNTLAAITGLFVCAPKVMMV